MVGVVQTPDEQQAAHGKVACVRSVGAIAMRVERVTRSGEAFLPPAKIARCQRHFGFGHHTACARHELARAESARGPTQQRFRAIEIAQLRHRDATQRQRRGIVSQRYALQGAERIARGERMRRGCDQ